MRFQNALRRPDRGSLIDVIEDVPHRVDLVSTISDRVCFRPFRPQSARWNESLIAHDARGILLGDADVLPRLSINKSCKNMKVSRSHRERDDFDVVPFE